MHLQESTSDTFKEIWRRMEAKPEQYIQDDLRDVWYQVLNGSLRGVLFVDYTITSLFAKATPYCHWGMLQDTYLPSGFGFTFQRGSPYKRFIDNA